MPPLTRGRAAAEALTLLDTLARAPAAAGLVAAALRECDRKALRLAHPQLRDAVDEATTKLKVDLEPRDDGAAVARLPAAARWPRLEALVVSHPDLAALEALGSETWTGLRALRLRFSKLDMDAPEARALAAAPRRMPALRKLELCGALPDAAAAAELFRASSADDAPHLRSLAVTSAVLKLVAARRLAATGWRLEELDLGFSLYRGAKAIAALAAAPTFAIRRLPLEWCRLDVAALLAVANVPWPLEELNLVGNVFDAAAAAPALAALSRHSGLRRLDVGICYMSAAGFKALVEANWPALTHLRAKEAHAAFDGPHALGAAAFAGFPALEELDLSDVPLGAAGAALLASRSWPRLRVLILRGCQIGDAGLAALAGGAWPALKMLNLRINGLSARPTLPTVRRWAPALADLRRDRPSARGAA